MFAASKSGQVTGSTPPPPTPTNDPQFPLVTALITGDGTNGAQNNTIIDSSPNNLAVTRVGNTTQGSYSPYNGNFSSYFDGSGDWLEVASNAAFSLTSNFTFECWFNPTVSGSSSGVVVEVPVSNGLQIYFNAGELKVSQYGVASVITYTYALQANSWTHLALVRNGTGVNNLVLYLNGSSVATATNTSTFAQGACRVGGGSFSFTGYISNVRLVKGTAVYTSNFTPSTTPLISTTDTSLLTCQNGNFVDNSINNFTVTKNGDVRTQAFGPFEPVTLAPTSYSGYFDGSGDYLLLPVSANLAFSGDYTLECWVYLNSVTGNQGVYSSIDNSSDTNQGISISFSGTSFYATSFISGNDTITHQNTVTTGQWYHLAMVRSGSNTKSYLNGVQSTSTTVSSYSLTQSGSTIGSAYPGTNPLNGYISNLRILKGTALYTSSFTPPTTPLTAISNTQLLTCQSNSFVDNSINNFAITPAGDAKSVIYNPFGTTTELTTGYSSSVASGSVAFNGSTSYLLLPVTTALAFPADYTLEAWVYLNSVSGNQYVYSSIDNGNDAWQGIVLGFVGTSFVAISYVSAADTITHQTAVAAGQWYHVAMVRSGSTTKSYLNGVQSTSTTTSSYSFTQSGSTIGAAYAGTSLLNGCISNLRIVKGTALYTSSFTPTFTPLTAVSGTQLLTCQSSTSITDASTNAFTFTTAGTPTPTIANPYRITSTNGSSLYFDGSGDYLTVPANASVTNFGTGDFTIEAWVYPTANPHSAGMYLFDARTASVTTNWTLFFASGNGLTFFYNGATITSSGATFAANQWYHIAYSRSGTSGRLFINGVTPGIVTDSNNYSSTTVLTVGSRYSAESFLQGFMTGVRIIKGQALYKTTFVPPAAPTTTVSGTSLLLQASNAGIYDNAMQVDFETGGNAQISTTQSKFGTGSIAFDGTGDYLKAPFQPQYSLNGDFTVEAWVYLTTNTHTGNLTIASLGYNNSTGTGPWGFYLNGSGPYTLYFNTSGTNHASTTTATFTLNTWIHVTYCRSGSTGRFFVNGNIVGTAITDTSTYTGTTESLFVGIMSDGASAPFVGYMDDFRITKYARYVANFTPPTQAFPIY